MNMSSPRTPIAILPCLGTPRNGIGQAEASTPPFLKARSVYLQEALAYKENLKPMDRQSVHA